MPVSEYRIAIGHNSDACDWLVLYIFTFYINKGSFTCTHEILNSHIT